MHFHIEKLNGHFIFLLTKKNLKFCPSTLIFIAFNVEYPTHLFFKKNARSSFLLFFFFINKYKKKWTQQVIENGTNQLKFKVILLQWNILRIIRSQCTLLCKFMSIPFNPLILTNTIVPAILSNRQN